MTMKTTDPILAPSRGSSAQLIAYLDQPDAKDNAYAKGTEKWTAVAGVDFAVAATQFAIETADGTSPRWNGDFNPAGIGIPLDTTAQPWRIPDGEAAARLHIQCLYSLVTGHPHKDIPLWPEAAQWMQDVWLARMNDPAFPTVRTIGDLNIRYTGADGEPRATWAWDATYASQFPAKAQRIFGTLPDQHQKGTSPMPTPTRPLILLTAGHRNTTGGNAEEASLTPYLAHDYQKALTAAGYQVTYLQAADGDSDPDYTDGSLDVVGQLCAQWADAHPGVPLLLLDLHYEGSPAPGCFVIVPDVSGLSTAISVYQPGNDTWANNPLDVALARAISENIARNTGLGLRQAREPGVMSETQTGVGIDGWRLAMFAYTAPYRDRMVRLVVEHGNHTVEPDRSIILQNDFTQKCAAAAVTAINQIYGFADDAPPVQPPVVLPPAPKPPKQETLLPLPKGMTWELVQRQYGTWKSEWGETFTFRKNEAACQVWFNTAVRSIPAGKGWDEGDWPTLEKVIRRGNGDYLYKWNDGSQYVSKRSKSAARKAA